MGSTTDMGQEQPIMKKPPVSLILTKRLSFNRYFQRALRPLRYLHNILKLRIFNTSFPL
jgi:hypothetical protein